MAEVSGIENYGWNGWGECLVADLNLVEKLRRDLNELPGAVDILRTLGEFHGRDGSPVLSCGSGCRARFEVTSCGGVLEAGIGCCALGVERDFPLGRIRLPEPQIIT